MTDSTTTFHALLISGAFLAASVGAQPPARSLGPPGGDIHTIVVDPRDPSTVYAGTDAGVFKSTARGGGWLNMSDGLPDLSFYVLAIDPQDSSRVYASGTALYRSLDGGVAWERAFPDAPFETATEIAVDPTDSSTIFVYRFRLYRSTDDGRTWTDVSSDLPGFSAFELDIAPGDPSRIYASGGGIFVSRDGGSTWEEGLPHTAFDLTVDAVDPDVVYAAVQRNSHPYNRVFRSRDGGRSWAPAIDARKVAAHPSVPGTVYAGDDSGRVFRSADHGSTWELLGEPLPDAIFDLTAAGDGTVFVGSNCGAYRYDGAAGWRGVSGGLYATEVSDLVADPTNPGILYATAFHCGRFKSVDGGLRWRRLTLEPGNRFTTSLDIDPEDPRRLYATTIRAFFRSIDAGESWTKLGVGEADAVSERHGTVDVAPSDPRIVYVQRGGEVFRSTDRGATFSLVRLGPSDQAVLAAIDPRDSGILYALERGNLIRTVNAGRTWRVIGAGLPEGGLEEIAFEAGDPDILYVLYQIARHEWTIYKSVDGGVSFSLAAEGLEDVVVQAMATDPSLPDTVYAGTRGSGVYRSRDGAATWEPLGGSSRPTGVISVEATRGSVYAGRFGGIVEIPKDRGAGLETAGETLDVGRGRAPDVAVDGGGRFAVTWTTPEGAALASTYGTDDRPVRDRFRIGGDGDRFPVAAADGPGEALVVFRRLTATGEALRLRAFGADGKPSGVPARLDAEPRRTKPGAALARSPAGEAVAVWDSVAADGRSLLRGRRLGPGGSLVGEPFTLRGGVDRVLAPVVAIDAFGRFAVVWLESPSQVTGVRMQRYQTNGTPRGSRVDLSGSGADVVEARPGLAAAPTGELAVAWLERAPGGAQELTIRWLDVEAQPAGEQRLPIGSARFDQVDLAIDRFGDTLVVWSSGDGEGVVRARVFSITGTTRSEELTVGTGRSPSVAVDQGGGAVVVWQESGRIRAQRLRIGGREPREGSERAGRGPG